MENFTNSVATSIGRGLSPAYAHALKQRTDAFTTANPVMGLGAPPPRETEALR